MHVNCVGRYKAILLGMLLFVSRIVSAQVSLACYAPVPDNCSSACNLGTLPAPAACTGGTSFGAVDTFACTNAGAAANTVAITSCAKPASYVWYTFKATGTQLVLNILSLTITNPYVGLFKGASCNSLENLTCFTGTGGALTGTYNSLAPDSTYYLQISGGSVNDTGNFAMSLQNNIICGNCVQAENLSASPEPVNGYYAPGQTVSFCFTVLSYSQAANGWLHGIVLSLGAGWDSASLTATSIPPSCSGTTGAHWGFYAGDTSKNTGTIYPSGFYYETSDAGGTGCGCVNNNPGDNYGDGGVGANGCAVTFCWQVKTNATCATGTNLNMKVQTTDDYQSGAWTTAGCLTDPSVTAEASLECCAPPVMSVINPVCGGTNGSAIAKGGGTGPWQYNWTNTAGTVIANVSNINAPDTLTGLSAGEYFVTATDANNCSNTSLVNIGGNPLTTATANNGGPYCPGSSIALTSTTNNGTSFIWNGPNNYVSFAQNPVIANATTAMAGTYVVTISGAHCNGIDSTVVVVNPAPTPTFTPVHPIFCMGQTVNITAFGGTSYVWSTGALVNNISVSPMVTTTYFVTATDANNCTGAAGVVVTDSIQFMVSAAIIPVSCNAGNNGAIALTVNGTSGPYNYLWSTGSSSANLTNLSAGIDTVTVSDANQCSVIQADTVTQPALLVLGTPTIVNIGCYGNPGSIIANPTGGTPGYTYSWIEQTTGSTYTGDTISNLAADNYALTVSDANNCQAFASYPVTTIPPLTFTKSFTTITCAGYGNGTASVNLTSGTPPFQYAWDGNGTPHDSTMTGISPGGVSVVVTDANNCTAYGGFLITQPQQIYIENRNVTNVSCSGGADGRIVTFYYGGSGTLSPLWSNGPGGNTDSNLTAGIYTITVTDTNLCTASLTDTVTQPQPVVLTLDSFNALCYGGADGYAWAVTDGGTAPYQYNWSTGVQTDTTFNLSKNGSPYYCTVTDNNMCTATASVSINQPTPIYISTSPTAVKCPGQQNGTISVSDTGGMPPYHYSATQDSFSFIYAADSVIMGLDTGWYTVLVSDANGCTKETQAYVPNAMPDQLTPKIDSTLCYGPEYNDGSITVTVTPASNGPFQFSLDQGIYQASGSFYGVSAGNHIVTVINGNQCEDTIPVVVYEPLPVVAEVIPDTVILEPGQNKQVNVTYLNATNPSFSWTPAQGLSCIDCPNPQVNTYTPGMYTVTVSMQNDSAVCYGSATLWVELLSHPPMYIPDAFSPNGDGNNDLFMVYGENIKTVDMKIFNRWGELVFVSENQFNGWDGTYKGHMQLPGVFTYETRVTFLDNTQAEKNGTVTMVR